MPKASAKTGKDRTFEEAVSYAIGSRIRVEILTALNERASSATELARLMHQPLSTVTHHIRELLAAGSIEVARTVRIRNLDQSVYCAVDMGFHPDEAVAAQSFESRQEFYGLILQNSMAEGLASLWAGKISEDPRAWLTWRWVNVDEEGRDAIAEEQRRSWERMQEIEAESTARRSRSGESATSVIVTSLGFERSRPSAWAPGGDSPDVG
jgi:DNA-binding transcriptional ArsR family regulator